MEKTVEKLRADSVEHLRYEIWMMQETALRLMKSRELHEDAVLKNAMVESCVVHARSLTKFIYATDARDDDITSDDDVSDRAAWVAARDGILEILVTLNVRTAKEIAHLTTKRLEAADPAKTWPLVEIVALHSLLKLFVSHASHDRLDVEVARFIMGLRPPMDLPLTPAFNPLSTQILTASPEVRTFSTDMRARWPWGP